MCGILGLLGKDVSKFRKEFLKALSLLKHRGPDYQGWLMVNENLLLGHTRLSIIDLTSEANQPMKDEEGNVLVFNGEIYNYIELKEKHLQDVRFRTKSDTEVLLRLLGKLGLERTLSIINGMFAFLYWSNKEKKLFAVRDRFGKKPLFYTQKDGYILFSSEVKALKPFPFVSFKPSEKAFLNFLLDRRIGVGKDSFFREINSIPAGSVYVFSFSTTNFPILSASYKYWSLSRLGCLKLTYEEAKNKFKNLLTSSVKLRMRSDVPVAFLLSGGLDSSSLVSIAAKENLVQGKIPVVSAVYPYSKEDESYYAKCVVELYRKKIEYFPIVIDKSYFFKYLDKTIYALECPIPDGSMVAHHILMREISNLGIRVVVSGNGGDEILAGYITHKNIFLSQSIKNLNIKEVVSSISKGANVIAALFHLLPCKWKHFLKNLFVYKHGLVSKDILKLRYRYCREDYNEGDLLNFYLKMCILEWTLPGFVWYEDRNGMYYGIEIRNPFLDVNLVKFMLQIPGNYKIRSGITKKILRDTFKDYLPYEVLYRTKKQGFHSPINLWEQDIDKVILSAKNDKLFLDIFWWINFDKCVNNFTYKWRLFSIYKWYEIFLK
jgi:asparagine synthase (glutamine-hydrolysing)